MKYTIFLLLLGVAFACNYNNCLKCTQSGCKWISTDTDQQFCLKISERSQHAFMVATKEGHCADFVDYNEDITIHQPTIKPTVKQTTIKTTHKPLPPTIPTTPKRVELAPKVKEGPAKPILNSTVVPTVILILEKNESKEKNVKHLQPTQHESVTASTPAPPEPANPEPKVKEIVENSTTTSNLKNVSLTLVEAVKKNHITKENVSSVPPSQIENTIDAIPTAAPTEKTSFPPTITSMSVVIISRNKPLTQPASAVVIIEQTPAPNTTTTPAPLQTTTTTTTTTKRSEQVPEVSANTGEKQDDAASKEGPTEAPLSTTPAAVHPTYLPSAQPTTLSNITAVGKNEVSRSLPSSTFIRRKRPYHKKQNVQDECTKGQIFHKDSLFFQLRNVDFNCSSDGDTESLQITYALSVCRLYTVAMRSGEKTIGKQEYAYSTLLSPANSFKILCKILQYRRNNCYRKKTVKTPVVTWEREGFYRNPIYDQLPKNPKCISKEKRESPVHLYFRHLCNTATLFKQLKMNQISNSDFAFAMSSSAFSIPLQCNALLTKRMRCYP